MRVRLQVEFIIYYLFSPEEALLAIDDAVDLVCNNIARGLCFRQPLYLFNVYHRKLCTRPHLPCAAILKAFPFIAGTMNDRGNYGTRAYVVHGGTEHMLTKSTQPF